jgi:hypothetical protein
LPEGGPNHGFVKPADDPAVVTVTVTDCAAVPLSVTELGDTLQLDCAGAPVQLSWTLCLNPPAGLTLTKYVAVCPGETD